MIANARKQRTLWLGLAGSALMWAAQPPLAIGPLGWIAPVPWLLLVRDEDLSGRRPYRALWLAGFAFWLAAIQWLRLPHPAVYPGWIALAFYLAFYLPLFVALARTAVHRLGVPLWLAAAVVWTGLELVRAHLLSGFLMGSLAHTQVDWLPVIQISDLVGEYGVDFVMVAVAGSLVGAFSFQLSAGSQSTVQRLLTVVPGAVLLAATIGYGQWRLQDVAATDAPTIRIALVQGNTRPEIKGDLNREHMIMEEHLALSYQALAKARAQDGRPIDLIVWPESMFRTPLVTFTEDFVPPEHAVRTPAEVAAIGRSDLSLLVDLLGKRVVVGINRVQYEMDPTSADGRPGFRSYNSSVLVARDGQIVGTYDKFHLVMFGEYIPFSKWIPFLRRIWTLTGNAEPGEGPVTLMLGKWVFAPSICYETVIPHVIRRQAATLHGGSLSPDVLVNLTNDAWYWGSSELDMHLACDVFRAVETRRPMVVAAHRGLSAWIDHLGRVRVVSQRMRPEVILADVERHTGTSWYVVWGDWFAGLCLTCCVVLAIVGWHSRRGEKN